MSEAVSALNGKSHKGFCEVAEAGLTGMVTIRADLGSAALAAALGGLGLSVPAPRGVVSAGGLTLGWMSPDELMLMCEYAAAGGLTADLAAALAGEHALVVNVSDMRARFTIKGARADEVIMKLSPADIARLPEGEIRRSRAAQVAVAFWRLGPEEISVVGFRSVAGYILGLLEVSSRKGGEIF